MSTQALDRIYEQALRALPATFRDKHGAAMRSLFGDMVREVRGAGRRRKLLALLAGALWDIARQASVEHSRRWMLRVAPHRLWRREDLDG